MMPTSNGAQTSQNVSPSESATAPSKPYISVIIASYQRRARLLECLDRLARCDGADDTEVIVVEQAALPLEPAIVNRFSSFFSWFEHIVLPKPNVAAARNRGALRSRGEILLIIDDDVELGHDYLTNLAALFKAGQVDMVAGEHADTLTPAPSPSAATVNAVEWLPTWNFALRAKDFFFCRWA